MLVLGSRGMGGVKVRRHRVSSYLLHCFMLPVLRVPAC